MYNLLNLKELNAYIRLNENLLNNAKDSLEKIEKFLMNIGKPAGYKSNTSFEDYDCIHGSRKEYHADQIQKVLEEQDYYIHMVEVQEGLLSNLYKSKKQITSVLQNLQGIYYKVAMKRYVEGRTQVQTALELNISESYVQKIEARIRGGI